MNETNAYKCDNCGRFFSKADFLSNVGVISWKDIPTYSIYATGGSVSKGWIQEDEMWCKVCRYSILDTNA